MQELRDKNHIVKGGNNNNLKWKKNQDILKLSVMSVEMSK